MKRILEKHGIFTEKEIFSRYDILLENYSKTIHIESLTMQDMVQKDFFEGLIAYEKDMDGLRAVADGAEKLIPDDYLPYPTYSKLLFSLR